MRDRNNYRNKYKDNYTSTKKHYKTLQNITKYYDKKLNVLFFFNLSLDKIYINYVVWRDSKNY